MAYIWLKNKAPQLNPNKRKELALLTIIHSPNWHEKSKKFINKYPLLSRTLEQESVNILSTPSTTENTLCK